MSPDSTGEGRAAAGEAARAGRGSAAGWRRSLFRIGSALADQGLYSGTSFLVSVLLARWLTPGEYGTFVLSYSILLLVGMFHSALLTEPLMVLGAGKYDARFPSYLGLVLRGHVVLTLAAGALLMLVGATLGRYAGVPTPLEAAAGLAVAVPCILLYWLVRRGFYTRSQPHRAALGSVLHTALTLGLIVLAHRHLHLGSASVFVYLGVSALVVGLGMLPLLGVRRRARGRAVALAEVVRDHWRYGRWASAAVALFWLQENTYYAVLPLSAAGVEAAGELRAVINLYMPVILGLAAMAGLLIPRLARHHVAGAARAFRRDVRRATLAFSAASLAYAAAMLALGPGVLDWLYAGQYHATTQDLLAAGVMTAAAGPVLALGGALRAQERPSAVFWSYAAAVVVTFGAGVPLALRWGVGGALAGLAVSGVVLALAMLALQLRLEPETKRATPARSAVPGRPE